MMLQRQDLVEVDMNVEYDVSGLSNDCFITDRPGARHQLRLDSHLTRRYDNNLLADKQLMHYTGSCFMFGALLYLRPR